MLTVLQIIWVVLIAVLWTGYLILEGFGIGSGMIMHFVAKTDEERAQVQKTFGPVWDGNEVWLLTAGGATFAAFPNWYATMFSGMYLALFLILICLILRVCAIEWRSKVSSVVWRARWDMLQSIACWLVPILFGVAFANLVQGMNIGITNPYTPNILVKVSDINVTDVHNFTAVGAPLGSVFLSLLTPYTILGGLMLAAVFLTQGALWLSVRTDANVESRSKALATKTVIVGTILVATVALWGQFAYASQVLAWIPLVITALLLVATAYLAMMGRSLVALIVHSAAIAGTVSWVFSAMVPGVMKSYIDPAYTLTLWDASSSQVTLTIMLCATLVFFPCVLTYTYWSYSTMKFKITLDDVENNPGLPWDRIREGASFLSH